MLDLVQERIAHAGAAPRWVRHGLDFAAELGRRTQREKRGKWVREGGDEYEFYESVTVEICSAVRYGLVI